MTQDERSALVKIRLQRAKETLLEVKDNVELGHWRLVANRLYYTCFYAVIALLVKNKINAHTHAGVINQFGLHFIATGLISNVQGKFYKQLFNLRQDGDYEDWIQIDEQDVLPLVEPAEEFIATIENLISSP